MSWHEPLSSICSTILARVASLPDGVARALAEYLSGTPAPPDTHGPNMPQPAVQEPLPIPGPATMKIGDLCPECGEAALVNEEGCKKCYACGYSQC